MLNRTTLYFEMFFEEYYASNPDVEFFGVESSIGFTLYGAEAGIPEPRFDIYIDFEFADLLRHSRLTEKSKAIATCQRVMCQFDNYLQFTFCT